MPARCQPPCHRRSSRALGRTCKCFFFSPSSSLHPRPRHAPAAVSSAPCLRLQRPRREETRSSPCSCRCASNRRGARVNSCKGRGGEEKKRVRKPPAMPRSPANRWPCRLRAQRAVPPAPSVKPKPCRASSDGSTNRPSPPQAAEPQNNSAALPGPRSDSSRVAGAGSRRGPYALLQSPRQSWPSRLENPSRAVTTSAAQAEARDD